MNNAFEQKYSLSHSDCLLGQIWVLPVEDGIIRMPPFLPAHKLSMILMASSMNIGPVKTAFFSSFLFALVVILGFRIFKPLL